MRGRLAGPMFAVLALVSVADAGEPTERLRALFEQANHVLTSPDEGRGLDERLSAIRALVGELFDAREAAAAALGREWQARTAAQRAEFARLYAELVERAYLAWVGGRARLHGDGVRVAFVSESTKGETSSVVTTLSTRGAGEVPVEYRMRRREGRWLVQDVVVDGLSVADSYRVQFQRVLHSGGYGELMARIQEKFSASALAEPPAPLRVASVNSVSDAPAVEASAATTAAVSTALSIASSPSAAIAPSAATPTPPPAPRTPSPATAVAVTSPAAPAARGSVPSPLESVGRATSPSPPGSTPKAFWLQLGAFRDTDAVTRLVERLRDRQVTVTTGGPRTAPLTRVLLGPFVDRAAAAAALRQLAAAGYRAIIAVE
jgi:phospholipid transport system substrate-binding protein